MLTTNIRSLEASAALDPYLIVAYSNPDSTSSVAPASSGALPLAGTNSRLGAPAGSLADVALQGNPGVRLGGLVTAGDPLTSDAVGRGIRASDGDFIIGFADEPGGVDAVISYRPAPGVYRPGVVAFPKAATLWDFVRFPVTVRRDRRGAYSTDFNPRNVSGVKGIFDGIAAGTTKVVYADRSRPNDAGDGLTAATAKQSIRSAIAAGEADGAATAVLVWVAAGDYDRTTDMLATGTGATNPSKPTAVVAYGGPVIVGPTALLAWNAGSVVRSNVTRVINKTVLDSRGNGVPYVKLASKAAYDASAGADVYFHDVAGASGTANTLYAKRADGAVVSDANTRVLLAADSCRPGAQSLYVSGITFVGGAAGTVQRNSAATTQDIVAEDCQFLYPGMDGGPAGNAVTVDYDGICVLARCIFGYTLADAVNPHGVYGKTHTLVIGGESYAIGASPNVSCNALTGHGGIPGEPFATPVISINHHSSGAAGGSVRFVGKSQALVFGSVVDGDRGDVSFGGVVPSTAFRADDSAVIWAYEPTIKRCLNSFVAAAGAGINVRDAVGESGMRSGNGSIAAF